MAGTFNWVKKRFGLEVHTEITLHTKISYIVLMFNLNVCLLRTRKLHVVSSLSLRKKVMLYKEPQSPCNDEVVVYELFKYSAVTQETGAGVPCESM